jgi:hypothetical protein
MTTWGRPNEGGASHPCATSWSGQAVPAADRVDLVDEMKMIDGERFLASMNRSLTLDAPTSTNISTKLEPLTCRPL